VVDFAVAAVVVVDSPVVDAAVVVVVVFFVDVVSAAADDVVFDAEVSGVITCSSSSGSSSSDCCSTPSSPKSSSRKSANWDMGSSDMTSIFPRFTPTAKSSAMIAASTSSAVPPARRGDRFFCSVFLFDDEARAPEDDLDAVELRVDEPALLPLFADVVRAVFFFPAALPLFDADLPVPLRLFPDCDAIRSSCKIQCVSRCNLRHSGVCQLICQLSRPFCIRAAVRVLRMSMAMVMGPTPPGTGVMAEQMGATAS